MPGWLWQGLRLITGICVLGLSCSLPDGDTSAAFLPSLRLSSRAARSVWACARRTLRRGEGKKLSSYSAFQGVPSWNRNLLTPWSDPTGAERTRSVASCITLLPHMQLPCTQCMVGFKLSARVQGRGLLSREPPRKVHSQFQAQSPLGSLAFPSKAPL